MHAPRLTSHLERLITTAGSIQHQADVRDGLFYTSCTSYTFFRPPEKMQRAPLSDRRSPDREAEAPSHYHCLNPRGRFAVFIFHVYLLEGFLKTSNPHRIHRGRIREGCLQTNLGRSSRLYSDVLPRYALARKFSYMMMHVRQNCKGCRWRLFPRGERNTHRAHTPEKSVKSVRSARKSAVSIGCADSLRSNSRKKVR